MNIAKPREITVSGRVAKFAQTGCPGYGRTRISIGRVEHFVDVEDVARDAGRRSTLRRYFVQRYNIDPTTIEIIAQADGPAHYNYVIKAKG